MIFVFRQNYVASHQPTGEAQGSVYVTLYTFREFCEKKTGFYIFRIFKMIARFYKYDFWIPDKILSWNRKNLEKKIFFSNRKKISKKIFFSNLGKFRDFFKIL